jgi:hypothetical protein
MPGMNAKARTLQAETSAWTQAIRFQGDLSPEAARALLGFGFSAEDQERMRQLAAKARAGTLTPQEQVAIDTFERLGCLLDILHSQARRALKRRKTAS